MHWVGVMEEKEIIKNYQKIIKLYKNYKKLSK